MVLNPPLNVTYVTTREGLKEVADFLAATPVFGLDIETDPKKDYYFRRCRTIQVGNTTRQFVIDLWYFCDKDADKLFAAQGEYGKNLNEGIKCVLDTLRPFLCSDKYLKVGVNLGFECLSFYWLFGESIWHLYDNSVVERVIFAGLHSLKDYGFYSMHEMVARYFGYDVDKTLQESFTLDGILTQEQIEYAALDTRLPLALKAVQDLILKGETVKSLRGKGQLKLAERLERIDQQVLGDNLEEIAEIENDAIPVFQQMHVHGELLDKEKWMGRVNASKVAFRKLIDDVLDPIFLPFVGSKLEVITDEQIAAAEAKWKAYNIPSDQEIALKPELRIAKKQYMAPQLDLDILKTTHKTWAELQDQMSALEAVRKEQKEIYKKICSELKKKRTAIRKLAGECEGQALINYGSNAQLMKVLRTHFKKLEKIESLDDDTLEKYEGIPVMDAIREYHNLSKDIGTYGEAWANTWVTHPCSEEGWLHPGDGRLHCLFNQYDAATGRSSSSQPNAQNLPADKDVRSCFIADPPNEEYPDGFKLLTIDMEGAELRLMADEAEDPIWTDAYERDEDVHSICTELADPEAWLAMALPSCAYLKLRPDGTPQRKKCKCPLHLKARNDMKSTNFGLPYGIGPRKLSKQIKKTYQATLDLMAKHKSLFPSIWRYLEKAGKDSVALMKSFDMFGRRRIFPNPTWELAKEYAIEDLGKKLLLKEEQQEEFINTFTMVNKREPNKYEIYTLTHRQPTNAEISKAYQGMHGSIERQGKNHRLQSANASIIKLAMGSGKCKDGKPFLFHILPLYGARVLKMVHDELVILVPIVHAQVVAELVQDAFARAGARRMKKVKMRSAYNIVDHWEK